MKQQVRTWWPAGTKGHAVCQEGSWRATGLSPEVFSDPEDKDGAIKQSTSWLWLGKRSVTERMELLRTLLPPVVMSLDVSLPIWESLMGCTFTFLPLKNKQTKTLKNKKQYLILDFCKLGTGHTKLWLFGEFSLYFGRFDHFSYFCWKSWSDAPRTAWSMEAIFLQLQIVK